MNTKGACIITATKGAGKILTPININCCVWTSQPITCSGGSTGWPKKVSHYHDQKIVLNRIKTCE